LLNTARQFAGYFALLHNITGIKMRSTYGEELASKLVAIEFIYTCGFRLQTLFYQLGLLCEEVIQTTHMKKHPFVVVYSLEIVYRTMRSMGECKWDNLGGHVLHPLVSSKPMLKTPDQRLILTRFESAIV
jgi:hypothetical protein